MAFSADSLEIDRILLKFNGLALEHNAEIIKFPSKHQETVNSFDIPTISIDTSTFPQNIYKAILAGNLTKPTSLTTLISAVSPFSSQKISITDVVGWIKDAQLAGTCQTTSSGTYFIPNQFKDAATNWLKMTLDTVNVISYNDLTRFHLNLEATPKDSLKLYLPQSTIESLHFLKKSVVTPTLVAEVQGDVEDLPKTTVISLERFPEDTPLDPEDVPLLYPLLKLPDYTLVSNHLIHKDLLQYLSTKLEPWMQQVSTKLRSKKVSKKDEVKEIVDQQLVNQIVEILGDTPNDVLDYLSQQLSPGVRSKIHEKMTSVFMESPSSSTHESIIGPKAKVYLVALRDFNPDQGLHAYFFENFAQDLKRDYPSLNDAIEQKNVERMIQDLPSSDFNPNQALKETLSTEDAPLLLHAATLLFYNSITANHLLASGRFVPIILKQIETKDLSPEQKSTLEIFKKAQKAIIKSLKSPIDLTDVKQEIRNQVSKFV